MNKRAAATLLCMTLVFTAACQNKDISVSNSTEGSLITEESNSTEYSQESKTQETEASTQETLPEPDPPLILSGEAQDQITLEDYDYYEGDNYVLNFERGAVIYGDIALRIELVMADLEGYYGLSYGNEGYEAPSEWKTDYGFYALGRVNRDQSKIDIIICRDVGDGTIQWSTSNEVKLFDADLTPDAQSLGIVYHELTHLLRLRQSPSLGQVLEEGIAIHSADHFSRERGEPYWDMVQFIDTDTMHCMFDDSFILSDPEEAFREANTCDRSGDQIEYQYGIRFVTFLIEEYGPDIVSTLSENAAARTFTDTDNDTIIEIIKESTSDDVFERFAEWLPSGWADYSNGWASYMSGLGLL